METPQPRKPWYRKTRYIVLLGFIVILLLVSFVPAIIPQPPRSPNQVALNKVVDYFAHSYDIVTGLIPQSPGSRTYWLYSDNYLAQLVLLRFGSGNSSTQSFASALHAAFGGYVATMPQSLKENQYAALNSTSSNFSCSEDVTISWSGGEGSSNATIRSTANDGSPSCSSQNYADLLFLEALVQHKQGNDTAALNTYKLATADFDGKGIVDAASGLPGSYQTYKLALYVYASTCLDQASSDKNYATLESTLLGLQDSGTGGFFTSYNGSLQGNSTVNTETTALAGLALELMINPSTPC